jgi:L-ornithine N5-oxygenase
VRVQRDYRVSTTCEALAGIYIQGATEHTHGIGSTLLSNTAVRAGEILASILRHQPHHSNGLEPLLAAGERS